PEPISHRAPAPCPSPGRGAGGTGETVVCPCPVIAVRPVARRAWMQFPVGGSGGLPPRMVPLPVQFSGRGQRCPPVPLPHLLSGIGPRGVESRKRTLPTVGNTGILGPGAAAAAAPNTPTAAGRRPRCSTGLPAFAVSTARRENRGRGIRKREFRPFPQKRRSAGSGAAAALGSPESEP